MKLASGHFFLLCKYSRNSMTLTHCITLSSPPQDHLISHLLHLLSASCADHAWVELPGDRSRRVSGPEDCPNVGAGGKAARGQSPVQNLQSKTQRGIVQ